MSSLDTLYHDYYFVGANKLYKLARENDLDVNYKQVVDFLNKQNVAQLHQPTRPYPMGHITADVQNELWQVDILEMRDFAQQVRESKPQFNGEKLYNSENLTITSREEGLIKQ
jgi:hypothetical protein